MIMMIVIDGSTDSNSYNDDDDNVTDSSDTSRDSNSR